MNDDSGEEDVERVERCEVAVADRGCERDMDCDEWELERGWAEGGRDRMGCPGPEKSAVAGRVA